MKLKDLYRQYISAPLYFVLDEAQVPARSFGEAYRSAFNAFTEPPILRDIMSAWEVDKYTVVSGTGLSVREHIEDYTLADAMGPRVLEMSSQWLTRTETGAFDSPQVQSSYISRYLPLHLVQSVSGKLLHRCWSWLWGRYVSNICLIFIDT